MYIPRKINLSKLLKTKSHFLFGPRQTGKSTLIKEQLKGCQVYDLLKSEVFAALNREPQRLRQEVLEENSIVIIDEIQKLPKLLDEVHLLIEEKGTRFLLTGSSARKLRRGGVNLLGGRARSEYLFPFTSAELGEAFDLEKVLTYGLLPPIYFSDAPDLDLESYTGDYLKEEIAAEALTRNIPAFSRFLEVAALCNSQLINYSKIANDAQVATSTVREYFQILKDTLIADELPAWKKSVKRKPIVTSKMYFFDCGVVRQLQRRCPLSENSVEFGEALETFIYNEIKAYLSYNVKEGLEYWRSKAGHEVDFIASGKVALEVKASRVISKRHLKGLLALKEENILERYILICREERRRKVEGVEIYPVGQFLSELWSNKIF